MNRAYREDRQKSLKHVYNEADITAVLTFIIGDTVAVGIRSKENLEQMMNEEINKQKFSRITEGMACGIDRC